MQYNGILVLKDGKQTNGNSYGVFENKKSEFKELSQDLNKLIDDKKIHIKIKDRLGNTIFNRKGILTYKKAFSKVYDLHIEQDENNSFNLSQVLFEYAGETVSISIKELTESLEVIK